MNGSKMLKDFCQAALPGIYTAIILGLTILAKNHEEYFQKEAE